MKTLAYSFLIALFILLMSCSNQENFSQSSIAALRKQYELMSEITSSRIDKYSEYTLKTAVKDSIVIKLASKTYYWIIEKDTSVDWKYKEEGDIIYTLNTNSHLSLYRALQNESKLLFKDSMCYRTNRTPSMDILNKGAFERIMFESHGGTRGNTYFKLFVIDTATDKAFSVKNFDLLANPTIDTFNIVTCGLARAGQNAMVYSFYRLNSKHELVDLGYKTRFESDKNDSIHFENLYKKVLGRYAK